MNRLSKRFLSCCALALLPLPALGQDASTPKTIASKPGPVVPAVAAPAPNATTEPPAPPPAPPPGGTQLMMRGLEKITGRPTSITAPIGKPVNFATLTITARYCYSTPASETPETAAFVQIEDHRPDQPARRVFSGWMYASSPGLNAVEHPLYDVWVISCNNAPASAVAANTSTAPVKVKAPDSSDKEGIQALPEGAGQ
ncbi:MAG TPA: DUF2155 domain-containing protein [Rhizomicrobium sp.]|jgi:hypothetical protein|nr:DUF2155 domain-containing protein [Rhizomicrobium sp.]